MCGIFTLINYTRTVSTGSITTDEITDVFNKGVNRGPESSVIQFKDTGDGRLTFPSDPTVLRVCIYSVHLCRSDWCLQRTCPDNIYRTAGVGSEQTTGSSHSSILQSLLCQVSCTKVP